MKTVGRRLKNFSPFIPLRFWTLSIECIEFARSAQRITSFRSTTETEEDPYLTAKTAILCRNQDALWTVYSIV